MTQESDLQAPAQEAEPKRVAPRQNPYEREAEIGRTDRAFLKELFREYSLWSRHYDDQSTKVNLILVLISGGIIGLLGNDIKPIHGLLLMLLSIGAILSTAAYWSSYEYNNKLAVKIRKSFVEQDYFADQVWKRAQRTFKAESPMLSKMKFRNQYVYWFIIHTGVLVIGAFAAFSK